MSAEFLTLQEELPSPDSLLGDNSKTDLPVLDPYEVTPGVPGHKKLSLSRLGSMLCAELRNINPIAIAYASRPPLRTRLTLPGRTVCRNPWAYGEGDSHPFYRYSYQQQLLSYLHVCSRSRFTDLDNAPLPRLESVIPSIRSFGSTLQPRYVFGATFLDQ